MYKYKLLGYYVESDCKFVGIENVEFKNEPNVIVKYSDLSYIIEDINNSCGQATQENELGKISIYSKKSRDKCLIYCVDKLVLSITNGNRIEYMNVLNIDDPMFTQWLLCLGLAVIKVEREELNFHASGVMLKDKNFSFAICGESGNGKSTLSDYFFDHGYRFKADDNVPVYIMNDEVCMVGALPIRRLCKNVVDEKKLDKSGLIYIKDGSKEKYIFNMMEHYYDEPTPMKALFVLKKSECESVQIKEITGVEKIECIKYNLYRRDYYKEIGITTKLFVQILKIANDVKIYEIERPIGKDTVKEIADKIDHLVNANC